ncbi:MAG: tetratricopeptide repeat protein [Kiritimatiellaeota bacterium]|nr:tetratricopeptide repeat protein [Kiritimatiellota bacterium]
MLRQAMADASNPELAARAQLDVADTLLNQKRLAQALNEYQRYSESFPDAAGQGAALMGKGWCLEGLGRQAEAAAAFAKAADLFAQDSDKEKALCKAADALFADQQFNPALEKYRQVRSAYPHGALAAQALYQAGLCLARLGQAEEAGRLFHTLIEAQTGGVFAVRGWLGLAQVREDLRQWDEALAAYENVTQIASGTVWHAEAANGRAMLRYRLGQFKAAQADFEGLSAQFPGNPLAEQAGYMRGWCLYLQGQDQAALQVCRQFIEQHPASVWTPDVRFWLGEYSFNHADYPDAERQFAALAAQHPKSPLADKALYWAGRAATAGKEYLRAIEYFSRLAKQYPDSPKLPETRFAQGDALSELNQFAGAILAFDEVMAKFPRSYLAGLAQGRRGDCQFTLGNEDPARFADALSSYRAVRDNPTADRDLKWQAEFKMGRCLEKMGRKADALACYLNVVYGYLAEREKGFQGSPLWFTRAAFNAAALQESASEWRAAVNVYRRVADAGVPASADAWQRIQKIRLEHWVLF